MADFEQKELEQRLSLYQVFLKLYEHHRSLLDEILELENIYYPSFATVRAHYVQGVVDASVVHLITNLCENKTQSLRQPQQIWTIGRNHSSGIHIADIHLSRRHAAIQHIENQGFYLIDFNSTNGTFVNGQRAHQPIKLKDGDRIKLGSMTFDFFVNQNCTSCILPTVAIELLMQLTQRKGVLTGNLDDALEIKKQDHGHDNLSAEQKSEILDRFFSRAMPYLPS